MFMNIVVDDLMTHYDRAGSGQTVLFLHGWADKLSTFDEITGLLKDNYNVVRLDLPGFGQTEAPKNAWNLDDYVDFVHKFLKKLGCEPNCIVGHSNGGSIAIRGLSQGKLKTEKLILLASAGVRISNNRKRTLKLAAKIGKVSTSWLPKNMRIKLRKKLYSRAGSDLFVAEHMQNTFKLVVAQDIQPDALKLKLPTLLVYGQNDASTPVESVGKVLQSKIADSRLEVINDADHFVHQTAVGQVAQEITEFIENKNE